MNYKAVANVLCVILAVAIGGIFYLYSNNPVKGYHLVYERENFLLFAKDTTKAKLAKMLGDDGQRISYRQGVSLIKEYRKEIITHEDSMKMTRYINFKFDNVFAYMTYIIGKYPQEISSQDQLGFRVYIGKNITPTRDLDSVLRQYHTVLFAPVKANKPYKFVFKKDFEFFNQGSICPINCPDDDTLLLK